MWCGFDSLEDFLYANFLKVRLKLIRYYKQMLQIYVLNRSAVRAVILQRVK